MTMATNYCLKICYHGEMGEIVCKADSSYEDVLSLLIARFEIPVELQSAIILTNRAGYRFDKQLFEYFILLFPAPELVFYLRFNWQQLRREVQQIVRHHELNSKQQPAANMTISQKPAEQQQPAPASDYQATPVRRQNCFIGMYPNKAFAEDDDNGNAIAERRLQLADLQERLRKKRANPISRHAIRI